MNPAARCREEKERHPERFCKHPRCLWRIETRSTLEPGVVARNPCPKHTPLPQVEMPIAPAVTTPYPWCAGNPTREDCAKAGFCRRDPNCGD